MNIKRIVRYLELKSQLTAEELQMAETVVGLTESDKEALAGLLQPVKVKVKPATRRVYERCVGCGTTKGNEVHKNLERSDYHLFEPPPQPMKAPRSARAESLAGVIKKKTGDKEPHCVVCFETRDHAEHDLENGGHVFEVSVAARANEVLDKHNEDDDNSSERCTATREGGRTCNLLLDHNVHQMKTAMGYHEFVGSETAVGVGGD